MTELQFTVEVWDSEERGIEETLARCSHPTIARAAYAAAVTTYPGKLILLRNRAMVMEDSRRKRPMDSAPRDGSVILLEAELVSDRAENAFNGWVRARWSLTTAAWELFPPIPDTRIDAVNGWLPEAAAGSVTVQEPEHL